MEDSNAVYQDLSTKVYNSLKSMILSGELEQGQKLKQEQLAEQLGVSRTPLLQATSRLAKDKLVDLIPRRGAYVRVVSSKEMIDAFDIRSSLEPLGAELASKYISEENIHTLESILDEQENKIKGGQIRESFEEDCKFHILLMKSSGNNYLYDYLKNIINMQLSTERYLKTPEESVLEHRLILQAIKNHEAYSSRSKMAMHMDHGAKEQLEEILSNKEVKK
ncbi:MAG: GntR family transcriptional regulator [Spirochaetales bacterium]|nr:GntR family transcriptional regulator [Spirochaetales bacterium]